MVAAIVAAPVSVAFWLLTMAAGQLLLSPLGSAGSLLLPGAATVIAPLAGGLAGGLASQSLLAAVGSVAGFLVPVAGFGAWFGAPVLEVVGVSSVLLAMLTTTGHVAGVAMRPARRTT
ncbi:MAG TPA: hypothetical protein VFO78_05935 [Candidatus Limnocylindrales bacterium]|nr:hypothetical protein [Candidatus Limnocylindrales bacterium]